MSRGIKTIPDHKSYTAPLVLKFLDLPLYYLSFTFRFHNCQVPKHLFPSLVTDSVDQILIADALNSCLQILYENGILFRCIGISMMNIVSDLSMDENENLWVGELHSGTIKVLKYLTTQQEVQSILLNN